MQLYEVISYFSPIGRQKSIVIASNEQQAKELISKKLGIFLSAFTFESVKVVPFEESVLTLEYLEEDCDEVRFYL